MNTAKEVPDFYDISSGNTWIGGPTHPLQRQHIPGYKGNVQCLKAQNVHGKSFARVTAQCLNGRIDDKGTDITNDKRFRTNYKIDFTKPDGRKSSQQEDEQEIVKAAREHAILAHQQALLQYQKAPKTIQNITPIDRMPIVGYQGHRAVYRNPIKQVQTPQKPVLTQEYLDALQKQVRSQLAQSRTCQQFQKREHPVVGYSGFLQGMKSECMFGQSFEKIAWKSTHQRLS